MSRSHTQTSFVELASARYAVYRMLAMFFLPPTNEQILELAEIAPDLADANTLAQFSWYPAWQRFLEHVAALADAPVEQTQAVYTAAFESRSQISTGLPRESSFLGDAESRTGELEAELVNRYANAGLTVDNTTGLPADHISVQLEYLSSLVEQELYSWDSEDVSKVTRALRLQRAFLRRHLAWWLPGLERRVLDVAPESIYLISTRTAAEFIHHELDLIDLILDLQSSTSTSGGTTQG